MTRDFLARYGVFGALAAATVVLKLGLFYFLVGTVTNPVPVLIVSCLFVCALFSVGKNKWVPGALYAAFSVLMVCDAIYANFFNAYLSVHMIGNVTFLRDITESVKEVFRPVFLLFLLDAALILLCLAQAGRQKQKKRAFCAPRKDVVETGVRRWLAAMWHVVKNEADAQKSVAARTVARLAAFVGGTTCAEKPRSVAKRLTQLWQAPQNAALMRRVAKRAAPLRKLCRVETIMVLLALLVVNPFSVSWAASIGKQEFFAYHLRDVAQVFVGERTAPAEVYLARGTYEQQLDGALFGVAEGRNLIVVQMESMQNMMLQREYNGYEITPTLNKLIDSPGTAYFKNFFCQLGAGTTSDAEFAANHALLGAMESYTYRLYESNYFKGLHRILEEAAGYRSYVLHGFRKDFWNRDSIYPAFGIEHYYSETYFDNDHIEGIGGGRISGISDSAFYDQATDYLRELPEPYYATLISLSCHHPFLMPDALKEIEILEADEGSIVGNYINAARYADRAIGELLEHLKQKDLYDNAVIVFFGDHFALTKADPRVDTAVSDFLGEPYRYDMMLNVPLIIHMPGIEFNHTFENTGGQIDLMPTLSYLLGVEKLDTLYLGQNLFTGQDSLVAIQQHMLKGSYIKGDTVFEMSRDGVFEHSRAWRRSDGGAVAVQECFEDAQAAARIVELSDFYLRHDILRYAIEQGRSAEEIEAILNGEKEPLPDALTVRQMEAHDHAVADALFAFLSENREAYVLLLSDDMMTLLEWFDAAYSGKSRTVGHASIDLAVNQEFLNARSRIIPLLIGAQDYTKVEYLGYAHIMVAPEFGTFPDEAFVQNMRTIRPVGLALPRQLWAGSQHIWAGYPVPIYLYDMETVIEAGAARVGAPPPR